MYNRQTDKRAALVAFIGGIIVAILMIVADIAAWAARPDDEPRRKGGLDRTTALLLNRKLGNIRLDHDDHVYKCIRIAREGRDIEGAVECLIEARTTLGDTLDADEIKLIIRLSNTKTALFREIVATARDIGKKKFTVEECALLTNYVIENDGKLILQGMQLAEQCRYRMESEALNADHLNLFIRLGEIKNKNYFCTLYDAMIGVGMSKSMGTPSLKCLYRLNTLPGNVPSIVELYLRENKWRARKQIGEREFQVIRDLVASQGGPKQQKANGKYSLTTVRYDR